MPNAEEILLRLVPRRPPEGSSEDMDYDYIDPETARWFNIRQMGETGDPDVSYFLFEMVPNGRVVEEDADGRVIASWDEPRIEEAKQEFGPNAVGGVIAGMDLFSYPYAVLSQGARVENPDALPCVVYVGGGFGVDSHYLPSLEACAGEIAQTLRADQRHSCRREMSPEEIEGNRREEVRLSLGYWRSRHEAMETALEANHGLLKGFHNMFGPLDKDARERILDYVNAPDAGKWLGDDEVAGLRDMCIVDGVTAWQAWCAVDPDAPRSGSDPLFPDPETFKRAVRTAVEQERETIGRRLAEAERDYEQEFGDPEGERSPGPRSL